MDFFIMVHFFTEFLFDIFLKSYYNTTIYRKSVEKNVSIIVIFREKTVGASFQ
jgi:hypothetical protein